MAKQPFEQESPTRPALHPLVPLDAVPVLAVPRSQLPWDDLGEIATQLLARVDGSAPAMSIVTGATVTPGEAAHELGHLVDRGILRLAAASVVIDALDPPGELDIDLSTI